MVHAFLSQCQEGGFELWLEQDEGASDLPELDGFGRQRSPRELVRSAGVNRHQPAQETQSQGTTEEAGSGIQLFRHVRAGASPV